jgi:hypothetical protein
MYFHTPENAFLPKQTPENARLAALQPMLANVKLSARSIDDALKKLGKSMLLVSMTVWLLKPVEQ